MLYLILLEKPGKGEIFKNLVLKRGTEISILEGHTEVDWKQKGNDLEINFPGQLPGKHAFVLKFSELPGLLVE